MNIVKAESNQRKLLEAKLAIDILEMAQRKELAAVKAAEEESLRLELEKRQKAEASGRLDI